MSNRMLLSVLCIGILLTVIGCSGNPEEQTGAAMPASGNEALSGEDTAAVDVTEENGLKGQSELPECYRELIASAQDCLEGKTEGEPEDFDFSYIIYQYGPNPNTDYKETLGYLIEDVDGNGTEELIFGENGTGAWEGVIYDLYTVHDGELVHVFSGGERDRYFLCENGMIANEGSSSAATSSYVYYVLEGTDLHLAEALLFNAGDSPDHPMFYSTQTDNYYDLENAEPIDEEQWQAVMDKYVYERPEFKLFIEK